MGDARTTGEALRLLIVEDSATDAELEVAILEEAGYTCNWTRVETRAEFLAQLALAAGGDHEPGLEYDLILADHSLPGFGGLQALDILRHRGFDIPFILISGMIGEEQAVESLKTGATDYVMKTRLERLVPVVARALAERETRRQREQAEAALRASEARFRTLIESAPDATLIANSSDHRIAFTNRHAEQLFGYAPGELLGQPVEVLVPERLRQRHLGLRTDYSTRPVARPLDSGLDLYARRKDGSEFPADIMLGPVTIDGELLVLTIVRDITERKEAEAARRRLDERYRVLVENLSDAIFSVDLAGVVTYMSPAIARISDYRPEDIIGRPFADFVHRDDLATVAGSFRRTLSGQVEPFEFRVLTKQAAIRFVRTSSRPQFEEDTVVGITGTLTDVTERKQAEDEIRRLNADLEWRVAERTAQLESANKELEAFSVSVSHDLRAPLRAIDGFSRILLEDYAGALAPEARHYLERVCAAAETMEQLIEALLGLARVTRDDIRLELTDLSALAHTVAMELHRSQTERQVEFVIAPGLVANADARLLRVVLENLLGNAWKYTSKQPNARIEFGRLPVTDCSPQSPASSPDYELVSFVRDNGAGFDRRYADRLFAPFQRLHDRTEFEGTGIGLATVQRIIHRHGGRIWAEGAVGEGATFYFTLARAA
ncbi:MAG: PAS domain S-box protein [Deltaproteobacteria bacterium]|nr:PAS domain S-box protein [Deltaproteobacteria bacterium]